MFKVKWKYDVNSKPEVVYGIHIFDDGETYFLMYQFGEWCFRLADSYEPLKEEI